MAISESHTGTETIGTDEWSLTSDTTTLGAVTDDGVYELFLDLSAVTAIADLFEVRLWEKVASGGTQRRVEHWTFGPQTDPHKRIYLGLLLHGWEVSMLKLAGTDRSITWSIRKVS